MFPSQPMNDDEDELIGEANDLLTITLLKQYTFCPRIAYYLTCTPDIRPRTYKMLAGEVAHEQERERAARRTLFAYQIKEDEGERHFDVRLTSIALGLTGIVDEVVIMRDQALVVDYKLADKVGKNHQLQLTAYALLAEETFNLPVERGYVYLLKTKRFESVAIDATFRNSVLETIKAVQYIQQYEYMPPPVKLQSKCEICEFRRFCIDL